MKRFIFVFLIVLLLSFVGLRLAKEKIVRDLAQPVVETVLSPTPTLTVDQNAKTTTSVFVPYWTLQETDTVGEYDHYIYFGITPTKDGIAQEAGAADVDIFAEMVPPGKKTSLTLRMIDPDVNTAILKSKASQKKVIAQTVAFAKEHDFSEVILDLEISAIPFDSLVGQINNFSADLSTEAKKQNLTYSLTLYGDTFYRVRPFDVKALSAQADTVMLMAYDFHKSRANPGPNFPLGGREKYGYDMEKMTDDVLQFVAPEKVSVIFGLFGYDWLVDGNGKAVAHGDPLTYQQIKQKFLNGCEFANCHIQRDQSSAETVITYTEDDGKKHVVWFEDMNSVSAKQQYLKKRGISSFSFWANGYF